MPDKPFKMFNPKGRDLGSAINQTSQGMTSAGGMGDDPDATDGKMQADQAGYMELDGATKDADCSKVQVDGGVSSDLGCCNEYSAQEGSQEFKCGTCTFLTDGDSVPSDAGRGEMDQSGASVSPDAGANPATARA